MVGVCIKVGLPTWLSGKESACQCKRHRRQGFDVWVRKIPWRRKWQPTPVFLLGKFHGQRSLVGYSPRGHKKSDMTDTLTQTQTHTDTHRHTQTHIHTHTHTLPCNRKTKKFFKCFFFPRLNLLIESVPF